MKKETVRRRIFLSNTRMVLAALGIILFFNLVLAKGYWELLEQEMRSSAEMIVDGEELEELLEELTVRRNDFLTVLLADGIFCVAVLAVTSRIFAGSLARHIMEPLDLLTDGAERVGSNDLTAEIRYTGDLEFEKVCGAFNHMQKHILAEQEKNRNPRTAVGMISEGHYVFVVVDGRQAGYSRGMYLDELAELMRGLGCQEAYNLDGGASVTMYFKGEVVNHSSYHSGDRPVTDCIFVN